MGCWSPNQPDFGGRRPVSGVDCAPRTPRCFSTPEAEQRDGLQASAPTTTYLQRLGSAVRCHVSERSATPPLSQRAASENGDGALPEVALGLHLVPGCLEQGTAQLLNLIYQEGQHHE